MAEESQEEHLSSLSQLLWIAVALLESDQEHEFHLALHMLQKLLDLQDVERTDILERFSKFTRQLQWAKFPGIIPMTCKGTFDLLCF